jgi:signal transduction histidine kinase
MFTKKNSGKVNLESQLGKGTKVTLTFPMLKKDAYDEGITN